MFYVTNEYIRIARNLCGAHLHLSEVLSQSLGIHFAIDVTGQISDEAVMKSHKIEGLAKVRRGTRLDIHYMPTKYKYT